MSAVYAIEVLQPRLLLSGTPLSVSVEDGTLFLRDESDGGHSNDIRIRIRPNAVRVFDFSADVTAVSGEQVNAHRVDVPLDLITTNRIAVYGGAGDDILDVDMNGGVRMAVSFAGGDGDDTWVVDGTPGADVISLWDAPEPGAVAVPVEQLSAAARLYNLKDLVVDDEHRLVFLSGQTSSGRNATYAIQVFDFDGEHVGTVDGINAPRAMAVYGESLYVAARGSGTVEEVDIATLTTVRQYDLPGAIWTNGIAVVDGFAYVTATDVVARDGMIGRLNLGSGGFQRMVLTDAELSSNARLVRDADSENSFYVTDRNPSYRKHVYRMEIARNTLEVVAHSTAFSDDVRDIEIADDGQRIFVAAPRSSTPRGFSELDTGLNHVLQYPTSVAYAQSVAYSSADGGLLILGETGYESPNAFAFHIGAAENAYSLDFGTGYLRRVRMDSRATRIFAFTDDGQFHVVKLPDRASVLATETGALGIGPGVESLTVRSGDGDDTVDAEFLTSPLQSLVLDGGAGLDLLVGTAADDMLIGGEGEDTLSGGGGEDTLLSTRSDDVLLGRSIDSEFVEGTSAEFAVAVNTQLYRSTHHSVLSAAAVTVDEVAQVDVWADFDGDGKFVSPGEQVVVAQNVYPGQNVLTFAIPDDAVLGATTIRFALHVSDDAQAGADSVAAQDVRVFLVDADVPGRRVIGLPRIGAVQSISSNAEAIELQIDGRIISSIPAATSTELFIRGSMGRDRLVVESLPAALDRHVTVRAAAGGDEVLNATGLRLRLEGGGGHDTIIGGTGRDTLAGGLGNDSLTGNDGNDVLLGSRGWDTLDGGTGNDIVKGQASADTLTGGTGNDRLVGSGSSDVVREAADVDFVVMKSWLLGVGRDRLASIERVELTGGSSDNVMDASAFRGSVVLHGEGGNDTLIGARGNDVLNGGADDDQVSGGPGADSLSGGSGDDLLTELVSGIVVLGADSMEHQTEGVIDQFVAGEFERVQLEGGRRNDSIDAREFPGIVILHGGAGDDSLTGSVYPDQLDGGDGDDLIDGWKGNDVLRGRDGRDTLIGGVGRDTLEGDAGDDSLSGATGNDSVIGGAGSDFVDGGRDNDVVFGNEGDDTLRGGRETDTLYGGDGNDLLSEILGGRYDLRPNELVPRDGYGETNISMPESDIEHAELIGEYIRYSEHWFDASEFHGAVTLQGSFSNDILVGTDFDDVLIGGRGDDGLEGGPGDDVLDGKEGDDQLLGYSGDDTLTGGQGNDIIDGDRFDTPLSIGDDVLDGGAGYDTLWGGPGNDVLSGGDGWDRLLGRQGSDTLDGGDGTDTLVGSDREASDAGDVFADPDEVLEAFEIDFEARMTNRAADILREFL